MSTFSISRLVVLAPRSQSARAINFHPRVTVLTGPNRTGKSSLLKALMYAFGAEPKMLPAWKAELGKVLVYFQVDGRNYKILRDNSTFTMFGANSEPLGVFSSVTNELGPWMGQLLRFGVKLMTSSGELITPPPAFFLLPFYFDQDTGWTDNWNSFTKLGQFKNWKRDLIEYHVGLKPNEYYDIKGKHLLAKTEMAKAEADQKVLRGIRDQIAEEYQEVKFAVDLEAFQAEITELLISCNRLQKDADRIKDELVDLHTKKRELDSQIEVVGGALKEINSDYQFLESHDEHVDCPTCGAAYTASFAEVFGIARDEGTCEHLLQGLRDDQDDVVKKIDRYSQEHRKFDVQIAHIRTILSKRQQEVELKDLIDQASKKQLKDVLQAKYTKSSQDLLAIADRIETLERQLNGFVDKARRAEIKNDFLQLMRQFQHELAVTPSQRDDLSDYTRKVHDQGSDHPRAVLAYGFSILHMMRSRSSAAYGPIIVDSPIQQEQDDPNHLAIVRFLHKHQPVDSQLILGIVDAKGVDFEGAVIELNKPRQVLRESEYEEAFGELQPLIQASLEFRHKGGLL